MIGLQRLSVIGIAFIFAGLTGCGGGEAPIEGLIEAVTPATAEVPTAAIEGKPISITLSSVDAITSVSMTGAPSWLTYDSTTNQIGGIPTGATSITNLMISVVTDKGTTRLGPYTISVVGDPLTQYAWHLRNTGQKTFSPTAGVVGNDINLRAALLQNITGAGIKIAVSDEGTEIAHEDLAANVIAGASKDYNLPAPYFGDPTPTDPYGAHGTAVAGIISAVGWNGKGSRGVAPNSKIAGLQFLSSPQTLAATIDQATGDFDIFNYSYGSLAIMPQAPETAVDDQITWGTDNLRGGKGALYVKSAGNDFKDTVSYDASGGQADCINIGSGSNGICRYYGNSNIGGNTHERYLYVGATNALGKKSSYSSIGSNIWIAAPGGEFGNDGPAIIAPDLQTCAKGYSSNLFAPRNSFEYRSSLNPVCNYTSTMNGTSSAAPIVSGVVALILEANPQLTWREVKYVLAASATHVDSAAVATTHPDGLNLTGHVYQDGWIQNGAGFRFHNYYGFGQVNADAAVALAKQITANLPPLKSTADSSGAWLYSSGTISASIPDASAAGTISSIDVRHNLMIEAVKVQFTTTHPFISDLGVELISPSGTKNKILNINSGIVHGGVLAYDAELLTNAFYGEPSGGVWKLKVIDGAPVDTGMLLNWKINVIGHVNQAPTDTTPPSPVVNLSHGTASSSTTMSPMISWTASPSSDVRRYEYSIGSTSGSTNLKSWTSVEAATSVRAIGLTLTYGQTYFVNVRAIDSSENVSTVVSSGWLCTNQAAPDILFSAPSLAKVGATGSSQFTLSYIGASSITLANADVTVSGSGATCSKTVSGAGTSTRTVTLNGCSGDGSVTISVAGATAINSIGTPSEPAGPSPALVVDTTNPILTGLSDNTTLAKSNTWTWSCNEAPCIYRYVIDTSATTNPAGGYSSTTSATRSTGTGTYYIHVQAMDAQGNVSTVGHASAVLDNTLPLVTGLADDATWTKSKTWTWSCDKLPCAYRSTTNTASAGTLTSVYAGSMTKTLSGSTGVYYLHVQAKDALGNESVISSYSAKLDNAAPNPPLVSMGSANFSSLTSSPNVVCSGSVDAQSGLQKYQVKIIRTSSSALVKDWADHTCGTPVGGLSLTTNIQYTAQVVAEDMLGNRSAIASSIWRADTTAPTAPTALALSAVSNDLSSTPRLTWTASTDTGGSGISFYQVRLKKASDSSVVQDWTTQVSGGSLTALSLTDDTNYQFEVRSWDGASNESAIATSAIWKTNHNLYTKIAVGNKFACGVTTLGSVKCWGSAPNGSSVIPKLVTSLNANVTEVAAGNGHACAIQNGAAYCWGVNTQGQLGDGTSNLSSTPQAVVGLPGPVTKISAGDHFSCAVASGSTYCWGSNGTGQLGNSSTTSSLTPVLVGGANANVTDVFTGGNHSCHVMNGTLECWGFNGSYQITGTAGSYTSPVPLPTVTQLFNAGNARTCGIDNAGAGYCWGDGGNSGLGAANGTPVQAVNLASGVAKIYAGYQTGYAIMTTGALVSWGNNLQGGLGNSTSGGGSATPSQIISSGVVAVAAKGFDQHVCALRSDSRVQCWGHNDVGQVGDGTTSTERTVPTYLKNY